MHISARRRALFPTMHPLAPIEVERSVITASLRFKIGPIMSLVSLVFWEVEKSSAIFYSVVVRVALIIVCVPLWTVFGASFGMPLQLGASLDG